MHYGWLARTIFALTLLATVAGFGAPSRAEALLTRGIGITSCEKLAPTSKSEGLNHDAQLSAVLLGAGLYQRRQHILAQRIHRLRRHGEVDERNYSSAGPRLLQSEPRPEADRRDRQIHPRRQRSKRRSDAFDPWGTLSGFPLALRFIGRRSGNGTSSDNAPTQRRSHVAAVTVMARFRFGAPPPDRETTIGVPAPLPTDPPVTRARCSGVGSRATGVEIRGCRARGPLDLPLDRDDDDRAGHQHQLGRTDAHQDRVVDHQHRSVRSGSPPPPERARRPRFRGWARARSRSRARTRSGRLPNPAAITSLKPASTFDIRIMPSSPRSKSWRNRS